MSVKLISKCLYVYLLLYSGWNLVESRPPNQRIQPPPLPHLSLLTVDLSYKKSTESVTYTRDDRNDADQFEAKDKYLFKKVLNDGQFIWEATGQNYAKKLLVRKDEKGDPKLTLYYHQPIPAPAAFKNDQRYDNAAQKYQPGSLDALPYGPYQYRVYDPYSYGPHVPAGAGELTRTPVITASTPVVVVPRRRGSRLRVSDFERGKKVVSFSGSDNEGSGGKSPTEEESSKGKGKPRDKAMEDDIEVVEELMSPEEASKGAEHGEKEGDKSGSKHTDSFVTGQDTSESAGHSEPRGDKHEPRATAASLDSSKVDNIVLKDLMDLVKALKNDVDLIKETLKTRDFDTSKLTGMATHKQPSVPSLVKEFSATGDSSTVKMYAFSPEDEGATGADGSQYGNKIVLTVGDHSNVYILDGNSNTMSVSTAKQELDDDEEEEEGGKEGSNVGNVYVNKSVPGGVGTLKGMVPPHSNLYIGGQGMATPVVMPGIQHTPPQPPKSSTKGESTDESPEDPTPSASSTTPATVPATVPAAVPSTLPTAVPAAVPSAIPAAVPSTLPTAVPAAVPSAMPAAVPASTSAGAVPKKKNMDDDRDENDDDDLKVTNIYGRAASPESTEDEGISKPAAPMAGAMAGPPEGPPGPIAQPPPVDQAPMGPPPSGPLGAPGAGLPMPPPGTPIAQAPSMGAPLAPPPGMAAPIPFAPDGTQMTPPPLVPGSLDAAGVPILGSPLVPGAPLSGAPPAEGAPPMPMPAFGAPIPGPLGPPGPGLPMPAPGTPIVPPPGMGAPLPYPPAPLGPPGAGLPMPAPGTPIVPPPGMPAPVAGIPPPGPLGTPVFGAPMPTGPVPGTGLTSGDNPEPAPLVPGGPTPSEDE